MQMQNPPSARRSRLHLLFIVLVWLLLYGSYTLFNPPLLDDADSVHSEVAREMLVRHDWVTLYANGIRYLEKAPLMYWSMATSFSMFGVHDWAARLPLALAMLGLLLAVYSFGRRAYASSLAGLYAALILATSFGCFIFTRIILPDIGVCLWITLSLYCFWLTEQQERPSRALCWGFAFFCALNVLTKGLIGIVFPIGILFVYLLLTRRLGRIRKLHLISSTLIFLIVAAPWHLLAGFANPTEGHPVGLIPTQGNVRGWFWFYFVNEHILRYLNLRVPRDYGTVPLLLFWGLLLIWLMPWSTFAFKALGTLPWRKAFRRVSLPAAQKTQLLFALWAAAVMLFFSFSTRQEYYVLPALPALALLIGGWLAEESFTEDALRAGRRIATVLLGLGLLGAAAAAGFALLTHTPKPNTDLASLLTDHPSDYALSFGHFLDLDMRAMGVFRIPLIITALALLVGTLGNWLCRRSRKPRAGNYFLVGMMVAFLIAAHMALVTFSPVLSSKVLADAIAPELQPQDLVAINGEYESGSTLGFYLQQQVHILNGRNSNLWYGSFFTDAPAIFETNASIAAKWASPQRIFLWTEPDNIPALPGRIFVLAESGGKEMISNQPSHMGATF
ncbi:MAG: ArnT family glycosyltransferase [Acidobacteriaceae bacterium]